MKKRSCVVIGSFSGNNIGDFLILKEIIKNLVLEIEYDIIYIPTKNTQIIELLPFSEKLVPIRIRRWMPFWFFFPIHWKKVCRIKHFYTTAGIIFEKKLIQPWKNFLIYIILLQSFSKLVGLFKRDNNLWIGIFSGVTIPSSGLGKALIDRIIKNHSLYITRDYPTSLFVAKRIGTDKVYRSFDILVKMSESKISNNNKCIGVNINGYAIKELSYKKYLKKIIELLIFNGYEVSFFCTTLQDIPYAWYLRYELKELGKRIEVTSITFESDSILNKYDLVIGSRLHSCVLALSLDIPAFAIPYEAKVTNFYKDIKLTQFLIGNSETSPEEFFNRITDVLFSIEKNKVIIAKQMRIAEKNKLDAIRWLTKKIEE